MNDYININIRAEGSLGGFHMEFNIGTYESQHELVDRINDFTKKCVSERDVQDTSLSSKEKLRLAADEWREIATNIANSEI